MPELNENIRRIYHSLDHDLGGRVVVAGVLTVRTKVNVCTKFGIVRVATEDVGRPDHDLLYDWVPPMLLLQAGLPVPDGDLPHVQWCLDERKLLPRPK
jgi:hypothetical protein